MYHGPILSTDACLYVESSRLYTRAARERSSRTRSWSLRTLWGADGSLTVVSDVRPLLITGGVVANNEERHIERSLRSLLSDPLPPGAEWHRIWVVVSGSTDRTEAIARAVSKVDPRVEVIVERERRGKAAAVGEVLVRAKGDLVLLLNADAFVERGAVGALLRAAQGLRAPFGVMGRPVPPEGPSRGVLPAIGLLWDIHHALHERLLSSGRGTHLSDELLLLSLEGLPTLPDGVVNDGAFLAARITRARGTLRYALDARVVVSVPLTFRDLVAQRRRILYGHRQVTSLVGIPPSTMGALGRQHPREAMGLLLRTVRARRGGWRALVVLATAETAGLALSLWDAVPPRRDHVRWERLPEGAPTPDRTPR